MRLLWIPIPKLKNSLSHTQPTVSIVDALIHRNTHSQITCWILFVFIFILLALSCSIVSYIPYIFHLLFMHIKMPFFIRSLSFSLSHSLTLYSSHLRPWTTLFIFAPFCLPNKELKTQTKPVSLYFWSMPYAFELGTNEICTTRLDLRRTSSNTVNTTPKSAMGVSTVEEEKLANSLRHGPKTMNRWRRIIIEFRASVCVVCVWLHKASDWIKCNHEPLKKEWKMKRQAPDTA